MEHPSNQGGHWVLCAVCMCLLVFCNDHWRQWVDLCANQLSGIGHCYPRGPCMWDLPVHGRHVWVGMNASGLSIDTDGSSNSENFSVWYTIEIDMS